MTIIDYCQINDFINRNLKQKYFIQAGEWQTEQVIEIPAHSVEGWALPNMPSLITDILISLDDRYLYVSNWLHGDVHQYDITDRRKPKLVGRVSKKKNISFVIFKKFKIHDQNYLLYCKLYIQKVLTSIRLTIKNLEQYYFFHS